MIRNKTFVQYQDMLEKRNIHAIPGKAFNPGGIEGASALCPCPRVMSCSILKLSPYPKMADIEHLQFCHMRG